MSAAQRESFTLAQVAGILAAAGLTKSAISNQTTLMLVPLMRALDPFNAAEVAEFAIKAAQMVEIGRQEIAKTSWGSIAAQLAAHGRLLPADYARVGKGRKTALDQAYRRPAADYRRRMAAGVDSIKGVVAQMEEERFQALGGAVVAEGRTGESNAKIEGTKRSPGKTGGTKGSTGKPASSGGAAQGGAEPKPKKLPTDRAVNEQTDDWDAADRAARDAADAQDAADDAAFEAEQELREQSRLSEEERQRVLEQVAEHEMEMRAERMINDDISMAERQAAQDAMKAAPRGAITGYRRVLHPELAESGESCGLCVASSDRVYKVAELLPIHNLCNCKIAPIIDGNDPGSQINDEDLATLYEQAGDTTDGRELKKQRYVVFEHPELGPVLRNAKHSQDKTISFSSREKTGRENA